MQASITFSTTDGLFYAPFQLTLTPEYPGRVDLLHNQQLGAQQAVSGITYSGTTATVTIRRSISSGDMVQIAGDPRSTSLAA